MSDNIPRWAAKAVEHALSVRRIVYIAGARQCGKTTLLDQVSVPGADRRTLDDDAFRRAAASSPKEFVARTGPGPMLIDEVQKVPDLFSAIKMQVDRDRTPGQYLITGSTSLAANPNIHESLAGRMKTVRLRSLSEGEFLRLSPGFLDGAFEGDFEKPPSGYDKRRIIDFAFRGGYPEAADLPPEERADWHRDYLDTLLARDVRDIQEIRNLPALRRMAVGLAGYSSKFLNKAEFARAYEVSKPTVDTYVAALEALYLFDPVPAWTPRDYDRAVKSPKWFASDTGTMAALLDWSRDDVFFDDDRSGKLMETFAHHELAAEADLAGRYRIYHYRDEDKREVDFILSDGEGRLLGIEVKSGSAVRSDDFKHLDWFRGKFSPDMVCIVLYTGDIVLPFGSKRYAVPFSSLFGRS